nr:MAG TPA: hypothetical protein [Caudoviricetes sp.]
MRPSTFNSTWLFIYLLNMLPIRVALCKKGYMK